MYENVFFIFLILAIAIIFLIIIQKNNSVNIGSSFRQSSLKGIFNSTHSGNFITKLITILAIFFFIFSLILNNLNNKKIEKWKNIAESKKTEFKKSK